YPLKLTTSIEASRGTFTTSQEVTELSKATLDPGLFEIPDGYTEAKDLSEFMGHASRAGAGKQTAPSAAGTGKSAAATSATGLPRKNPDISRIGVPLVKNATSQKVDPAEARAYLIQMLKRAALDPVAIDGTTTAELEANARAKDCDYI